MIIWAFQWHGQWLTPFSSSFFQSRETGSYIWNVSALVSLGNLADCYFNWRVPPWSKVDTQGCWGLPPCAQQATLRRPWDQATWSQEPRKEERVAEAKTQARPLKFELSPWGHFPCILCFHPTQCLFNVEHSEVPWWAIQARETVFAIVGLSSGAGIIVSLGIEPELEVILCSLYLWAACPQREQLQSPRSLHHISETQKDMAIQSLG